MAWHDHLIAWQDPDDQNPQAMYRRPFAERVDLGNAVDAWRLEVMWRKVAVAGRKLFWQLFHEGDDRLQALGQTLSEALWNTDQVITVISNEVIVPWSMLYVPRPGTLSEPDNDFKVDRTAFLGYRHLIEHTFEMKYDLQPDIRHTRLAAGAYFDEALEVSTVAPVLELLNKYAELGQGTSRQAVEERLRGQGAGDHLIYFCCHCVEIPDAAELRMTGGEAISSGDIGFWLGASGGLRGNPFVLVNACKAGEFGSHPPSHFGSVLLQKGASSLLGPSVNIPAVFAKSFAEEFLTLVLASKYAFGRAVRQLAQKYVDSYDNPLGLSYSLFHGIDGHFCLVETSNAAAPAES